MLTWFELNSVWFLSTELCHGLPYGCDGAGALALMALQRPEAAAALRQLSDDLKFYERISAKFFRQNADPDLRVGRTIE